MFVTSLSTTSISAVFSFQHHSSCSRLTVCMNTTQSQLCTEFPDGYFKRASFKQLKKSTISEVLLRTKEKLFNNTDGRQMLFVTADIPKDVGRCLSIHGGRGHPSRWSLVLSGGWYPSLWSEILRRDPQPLVPGHS